MANLASDEESWEWVEPDVSRIVTEDDTPLESVYQEKQQRLLATALWDSWSPPVLTTGEVAAEEPLPFVVMTNVGLFHQPERPPIVPDMLLSLGVRIPSDLEVKRNRSYFVWQYGKPPDLVVEVVSNKEGGELTRKHDLYQSIRVPHYIVVDHHRYLGKTRFHAFSLHGTAYVESLEPRFERLGLCLRAWEGTFEDHTNTWARWTDLDGQLILTGAERAALERERAQQAQAQAEQAQAQAEQAQAQAEQAQSKAERLAARLRELGVDPDTL